MLFRSVLGGVGFWQATFSLALHLRHWLLMRHLQCQPLDLSPTGIEAVCQASHQSLIGLAAYVVPPWVPPVADENCLYSNPRFVLVIRHSAIRQSPETFWARPVSRLNHHLLSLLGRRGSLNLCRARLDAGHYSRLCRVSKRQYCSSRNLHEPVPIFMSNNASASHPQHLA